LAAVALRLRFLFRPAAGEAVCGAAADLALGLVAAVAAPVDLLPDALEGLDGVLRDFLVGAATVLLVLPALALALR